MSDAEAFANVACFGKIKCYSATVFANGSLDESMVALKNNDRKRELSHVEDRPLSSWRKKRPAPSEATASRHRSKL
jgi:hypothetical protein